MTKTTSSGRMAAAVLALALCAPALGAAAGKPADVHKPPDHSKFAGPSCWGPE